MSEPIKTDKSALDILGEGLSNLYATGANAVSGAAEALGLDMSGVPEYTGESIVNFWKGLAGDTQAANSPVTTRGGEDTTLGNVAGFSEMASSPVGAVTHAVSETIEDVAPSIMEGASSIAGGVSDTLSEAGNIIGDTASQLYEGLPEDVKTGISGLGKAAQLGAMGQVWNAVNAGASNSLTNTANTIEQLLSADNKRSI